MERAFLPFKPEPDSAPGWLGPRRKTGASEIQTHSEGPWTCHPGSHTVSQKGESMKEQQQVDGNRKGKTAAQWKSRTPFTHESLSST